MSYLAIILIVLTFLKNNNGSSGGILNAIKNLDISTLTPLLELMPGGDKLSEVLNADFINEIASGNFNVSKLLPILMTVFSNISQEKSANFTEYESCGEGLNPIKNVFDKELEVALENYFTNY